jgi:PAS domain S-box-containing protein
MFVITNLLQRPRVAVHKQTPTMVEKELHNDSIHLDVVKKVFPLSLTFLCIYTPYSFFFIHDYLAGWSLLGAIVVHILCVSYYFKPENTKLICNVLIGLGFPVLLPWLFTGGPSGHALWWSPIYALWVSYFATKKKFITWMSFYVLTVVTLVVFAEYGFFTIAYQLSELLNILFGTIISSLLIYFYEEIRHYYEQLSKQEALKILEMQERYLNLLESAPDPILVFDENEQVVLANRKAEQFFGYSKAELEGCDFQLLFSLEHKEQKKQWGLAYAGSGDIKITAKRKDGSTFSAEMNTSINEKERTATATIRDVSERVFMTNILMKQNKQLEHFTQIASHNLRGPVGNLQSLLFLMNIEKNQEERAFLLSKFENVVANLNETLNEMLEMVKMKQDITLERTLISFEAVLNKISDSFAAQILTENASISYDFSKASVIHYNNVYLESILQNLLSNALKYRSPKRDPVIKFETDCVDGHLKLRVIDNGLGMNLAEYGHKLFGVHQTFHQHEDAKGVGLFIIKTQIEAMGGEITVESEVNKGTTFQIVFERPKQEVNLVTEGTENPSTVFQFQ